MNQTFKLCFDGKKINSSISDKSGDIDLFGFEGSPTLLEKQERLREEKSVIGNLKYVIQEQSVKNKVLFEEISEDIKENVLKSIRKVITILSRRLQELRETHLSKEQALVKFKKWQGQIGEKVNLYLLSVL